MEFSSEEKDQAVQTSSTGRARWHLADAASRHRSRPGVSKVYRMFSLPGRLPCAARSSDAQQIYRAALSHSRGGAGNASARYRKPDRGAAKHPRHRLLEIYEKVDQKLSRE